jgi:MATE family multidrug resistance protein
VFLALRNVIPRIFTTWDEAIDVAAETIPLIAFMEIFDSLQICASGVLRGAGMQVTGMVHMYTHLLFAGSSPSAALASVLTVLGCAPGFLLNIVAYYVIGLPLGFYFAFKLDRKIYGLYEGLCLALILVSIAAVYIVVRCAQLLAPLS